MIYRQQVQLMPLHIYVVDDNKSDLQSLDFVINRFYMKLFTSKSIETVKYCQEYFDFSFLSVLWAKLIAKFEMSFQSFLSVL